MNEISTEKLVADVKVLIADVEELIAATAGMAGDRVIELRERLERKLAQGKTALAECEKDLRERGEQAVGPKRGVRALIRPLKKSLDQHGRGPGQRQLTRHRRAEQHAERGELARLRHPQPPDDNSQAHPCARG